MGRSIQIDWSVKIRIVITSLVLMVATLITLAGAVSVSAGSGLDGACGAPGMSGSAVCGSRSENAGATFGSRLVNTMLFVLGVIAVIMIIFGGFKYMTANGDSSKISSAKNTILYSVVGLVVAIMAWGIITFVVNQLNR